MRRCPEPGLAVLLAGHLQVSIHLCLCLHKTKCLDRDLVPMILMERGQVSSQESDQEDLSAAPRLAEASCEVRVGWVAEAGRRGWQARSPSAPPEHKHVARTLRAAIRAKPRSGPCHAGERVRGGRGASGEGGGPEEGQDRSDTLAAATAWIHAVTGRAGLHARCGQTRLAAPFVRHAAE